jgi:ATP-dependent Clp protease adaptor protein ClpS
VSNSSEASSMSEPNETDDSGGETQTIVRTLTRPKSATDQETRTRRQPPYNVIILNDEEHTFEYVIDLLTKLFAHPLATAETLTWRIHNTGRAIVYTTHKEKAELKREQVLSCGADPRMSVSKGPLGCYIEPAPTD